MNEKQKWKVRERGMAIGVFMWHFCFSLFATAAPEEFMEMFSSTNPALIFWISIAITGSFAGASTQVIYVYHRWVSADYPDGLTEWGESYD